MQTACQFSLQMGEMAPTLPGHDHQPMFANYPIIPGWQQSLQSISAIIDTEPLPHVWHESRIRGEHAIGDATAEVGLVGERDECRARSLTNAEKADSARIGVRPALEISES